MWIRQKIAFCSKYKWLVEQLVQRDLNLKYKRSILGHLWSLLQPLLMMAVMSIIFSQIFRYNVKNYAVYLITGNVIFSFFSEATTSSMSAIISNAGLIKKVYIPKCIFPFTKVMVALINMLYSLIAVAIILFVYRIPLSWNVLFGVLLIIYVWVFALGIGLVLATAATFFRDILYLYGIVLQVWMYFTPLFYPIEAAPRKVAEFIRLNPMYHYVTYFRNVIMYCRTPTIEDNLICICAAVISLIFGIFVFKKYQGRLLLYI